jgi:hypothetical protein
MQYLPAECAFGHAIYETALLQFLKGTLGRSARNVAPFGSPANGQAESAVIHPVVASCDFEKHGTQ